MQFKNNESEDCFLKLCTNVQSGQIEHHYLHDGSMLLVHHSLIQTTYQTAAYEKRRKSYGSKRPVLDFHT